MLHSSAILQLYPVHFLCEIYKDIAFVFFFCESFGSPTLTIEDGQYHLVIIAHNGLGNISVESEEKIKFKDNKITDTFAYSTNIDVESDKPYLQQH